MTSPAVNGTGNEPRMLTEEEREQLRNDLKEMMELLKKLREQERPKY